MTLSRPPDNATLWNFLSPKSLDHELSAEFVTSNVVFLDGDNFCNHITSGEATIDMTHSRVLQQKLWKNCPHPEKPFSNSKTISQIKFHYRIKNSARVAMQKNPLQVTNDLQRVFLHGQSCFITMWEWFFQDRNSKHFPEYTFTPCTWYL